MAGGGMATSAPRSQLSTRRECSRGSDSSRRRRPPGRARWRRRASAALLPLAAHQDVEAAAERIAVHEHGAPPRTGRRDGQRAGEGARSGAAPAADDADRERRLADALGRVGDAVHQPALAVGQRQHLLRPDADGQPPHRGVVRVPADEDDARPALGAAHPGRAVVADDHQGRRLPAAFAGGQSVRHFRQRTGRRAEPQKIVEKSLVLGDDERSAPLFAGPIRPIRCRSSGHVPSPYRYTTRTSANSRTFTVQRSGKSRGSWSKSVDNSAPVNIPITYTDTADRGDFREVLRSGRDFHSASR